jgi:hypothetical protein
MRTAAPLQGVAATYHTRFTRAAAQHKLLPAQTGASAAPYYGTVDRRVEAFVTAHQPRAVNKCSVRSISLMVGKQGANRLAYVDALDCLGQQRRNRQHGHPRQALLQRNGYRIGGDDLLNVRLAIQAGDGLAGE